MSLTLETLERLVAFDTVSGKPNTDIIAFIQDFLTSRCARCVQLKWSQKTGQWAKVYPEPLKGYEHGKASEVYRSF